jgi:hypothetical protein
VDNWTNITLASTVNLDGDFGNITKLTKLNDALLCFQEKAFSSILFNSRVSINSTDGVPIEISNNYKVDGASTISSTVGCPNKWSMCTTPSGIYFVDSNTDTLYLYNG